MMKQNLFLNSVRKLTLKGKITYMKNHER